LCYHTIWSRDGSALVNYFCLIKVSVRTYTRGKYGVKCAALVAVIVGRSGAHGQAGFVRKKLN